MRKLTLVFFLVNIAVFSYAQKGSNSPYSFNGSGELNVLDNANFLALGNSTITYFDSTVVNYFNPSSYSSLAKHQPLFSFGVASRISKYTENGASYNDFLSSIENFVIAFPFAKRFGLAMGLKPFASKGYDFSKKELVGSDSLQYFFEGSGSISEGFVGFSAELINRKGAKVSVGGNLGYLFGQIIDTRKSTVLHSGSSLNSGGVNTKTYRVKALHYTLGLNYSQKINDHHTIAVSAVFEPFQKINAEYEDVLFYSSNIDNPNLYDSLIRNDTITGNLSNVPTYTYGLNYQFNFKGKKKSTNPLNSQLSLHAAYEIADWTSYKNTFQTGITTNFLVASKMSFGLQYLPETDYIRNKQMTKFYHRVKYRAGVYYKQLPYLTNNEQVTDFGTTFGFGIPIIIKSSLSSVNFGFSYGNRGTSDSNALKESYYGISIGLTIAPGSDKWFVKRKLN